MGAKVNGKIVPLRYKLKNGDRSRCSPAPQAHPSKDWLTFVKTSRAQQKIRAFIKEQQREKSLQLGRELAEREFKRFGLNLNKLIKSGELKTHAESSATGSRRTCWWRVGYGKVAAQPARRAAGARREARRGREEQPSRATSSAVGAGDLPDAVTEIAKKVVGAQVDQRGADRRHRRRAGALRALLQPGAGRPDRRASSPAAAGSPCTPRAARRRWPPTPSGASTSRWDVRGDFKRPVTLRVLTADRPGLLADISQTFSKKGVNISQANCRATGDDRAVNTFEVTISDLKQLTELMRTIERLTGVYSVERV